MAVTATDLWKLLGYIQDDLRQTQAKLVELRTMLASLPLPDGKPGVACHVCGITKPSGQALADHLENVHGGTPAPSDGPA